MGRQPALHHAPIHGGPSTCADHHDDGCPDDNNGRPNHDHCCTDDHHHCTNDNYGCTTRYFAKCGRADHRLVNPTNWRTGGTSSFHIAFGSATPARTTSHDSTS